MEKTLSKCIDKILKENPIETLYIYGSFVNGYYKKDSDIDVIALTPNSKRKPIYMPPNISVHLIHPFTVQLFEIGHPYAHLKMVPVYNKQKCVEISDKLKSELVRRELIRFKQAGIENFDVLDPFNNYLIWRALQTPKRIKKVKRLFASEESKKILSKEYHRILKLLEQKKMVERKEGKYSINPNFVFDEGFRQPKENLLFKIKDSYCGWDYLRNLQDIIDFSRRRI